MALTDDVDKKVKSGDYDISDVVKGVVAPEVIDVLSFCLLKYSRFIPWIFVNSLPVIENLDKGDWAQVIAKAKASGLVDLREFSDFVLCFCRLDQSFLRDIGIPVEKINELVQRRSQPGFPYRHPSENVSLSTNLARQNAGKLKMFQQAGLSENDVWKLFNLFTHDRTAGEDTSQNE